MRSEFMNDALLLAKKAEELGEVPVGAVIVKNGEIVGRGYNLRETKNNALLHAETVAIDDACKNLGSWRLDDCEMYVTLEPCPMCAGAIINARIKTLVFGAYDLKAGCAGSVTNLFALPFDKTPEVYGGIKEALCCEILEQFFRNLR